MTHDGGGGVAGAHVHFVHHSIVVPRVVKVTGQGKEEEKGKRVVDQSLRTGGKGGLGVVRVDGGEKKPSLAVAAEGVCTSFF